MEKTIFISEEIDSFLESEGFVDSIVMESRSYLSEVRNDSRIIIYVMVSKQTISSITFFKDRRLSLPKTDSVNFTIGTFNEVYQSFMEKIKYID